MIAPAHDLPRPAPWPGAVRVPDTRPQPPGTAKGFVCGTHRLISPEDTLARAKRLMPILGITRIADVTGLDTIGVPVVMVTRPNAKSLSVAQGKGLPPPAAQASGLMEAIESYHAEHITLPLVLACTKQICFDRPLIDLAGLPRYADSRFDADLRTLWIEGESLVDGAPRWLPYELVHTDFTVPLPPGTGSFFMSSSGLSSGNHRLEAISHGLCELIERDCHTLWCLSDPDAQRASRVDLSTVDDPGCRDILGRFERAGVDVLAWDMTSDVGVAAFKCVIADAEPNPCRPVRPMGGMGCHPAREIALLRALTEAAQTRLTLIAGARDDTVCQRLDPATYRETCRQFRDWVDAPGPLRRFDDAPTRNHDSFEQDVAWELLQLGAAGLDDAVVVDLTKPELGVPVTRVVVPGLEVMCDLPGYAPGRRAQAVIARRRARPSEVTP